MWVTGVASCFTRSLDTPAFLNTFSKAVENMNTPAADASPARVMTFFTLLFFITFCGKFK